MENLLCDMVTDKPFAHALLDKTLQIQMDLYQVLLEEAGPYVQMVETADDYGTQRAPLISPDLFDEMILPRRKKLNQFIHTKAPQAKIFHHTCGSVYRLLPNLIATGVQVLNPIQPSAAEMDTYRLQKEFGDQLIFHGGIDEQTALIYGKEVLREEMKNRIASLGREGGYIMAPTSNFQDDMPLENIVMFAQLAREVGTYS
jgi:uroporphyrinogen decarboxylase